MKIPPLCFCLSLLSVVNLQAQIFAVTWGTGTRFEQLITSDGSPLTPNDFSFELGGFTNGFVPTAANIDEWVENWHVFDAITSPDADTSDGFIQGAAGSRFVGNASLNMQISTSEDADLNFAFTPGTQAYVFIRNSDTPTFGSEWLLYTSEQGIDWEFPAVSGLSFSVNWFAGDNEPELAEQVVWGGINGVNVNDGSAGEFTDTSTDFLLRTHTFENSFDGFEEWIAGFSVTDSSLEGDPDGDGINNLFEFFYDTDPSVVEGPSSFRVEESSPPSNRTFSFPFGTPRPGISFAITRSYDLETWTTIASGSGEAPSQLTPEIPSTDIIFQIGNDGTNSVVRITDLSLLPNQGTRVFYRLELFP